MLLKNGSGRGLTRGDTAYSDMQKKPIITKIVQCHNGELPTAEKSLENKYQQQGSNYGGLKKR